MHINETQYTPQFKCLNYSASVLPRSCVLDKWMELTSSDTVLTLACNEFPGYTLVAGLLAGSGL